MQRLNNVNLRRCPQDVCVLLGNAVLTVQLAVGELGAMEYYVLLQSSCVSSTANTGAL